jgi:hypothetical protein
MKSAIINRMKKIRKIILISSLLLTGLCLSLIVISAISNLGLPHQTEMIEKLIKVDKIHLAETHHLRQAVGDSVWSGWGQANIPSIAYNEAYAFLVGYPNPPDGWNEVPSGKSRGGPWEIVPSDTFFDQPYYRQPLATPETNPQAFTVLVGENWVSSLQTYDWARIYLIQNIRRDMPAFLQPIFPYRLFVNQLVRGSDQYITLRAHEAFHAYQGMQAPEKLSAAEGAGRIYENQYPWDSTDLQVDWQVELETLAEALELEDKNQMQFIIQNFLEMRAHRRDSANLTPELITYEKQREWVEGLARYIELEIWRQAHISDYTPLPDTSLLSDFQDYSEFETRWSREIDQITRMAGDEGDGRFYYTGMTQAYLLDWLMPEWKASVFDDGVWLDDLLAEAVGE